MTIPVKTLIEMALGMLKTVAKYTSTQLDDQLVEVLDAVFSQPELIALIESLLNDPAVQTAKDDARTSLIKDLANRRRNPETETAANSAGLGWEALIAMLPTIIRILLSLAGKRKA